MAKQQSSVANRDFKGMASNLANHDKPPGVSQVQINLTQIKRGQTQTRGGLRPVKWEN